MDTQNNEGIREPIQNALYATGKMTTDDCDEVADGIITYLNDHGFIIIPSTPPTGERTAEEILLQCFIEVGKGEVTLETFNESRKESPEFIGSILKAMELYRTHPEEREAVEFFTMQQFPTQEPGETFSKTVLIYNKEDHSYCDLGYYDFETNEWAILGDMSMKLICWCYIPDASAFTKGNKLREELHRGYC